MVQPDLSTITSSYYSKSAVVSVLTSVTCCSCMKCPTNSTG